MVALSLHSQPVLSTVCIDPLRMPRMGPRSSGFRNVYWCGRSPEGCDLWRAKVKLGGVLRSLPGGRGPQPHVVALVVAHWYAATFGPQWAVLVSSNQRRENPWRVWRSARRGGWLARVWIRGVPTEVRPLVGRRGAKRIRPNSLPIVFGSRDEARRAVWPWVALLYPDSWRDVVYRTEAGARVSPRKWRVPVAGLETRQAA